MSIKNKYIISQSIMSAATASFMPVFYVFLYSIGYSNSEIGWYYAIFWIASTIFEVPFGIFTDCYGTKKTMLISIILKMVGFLLLLVESKNLVLIIFIGIFTGVGEAGLSGCLPSWFVNENKKNGERECVSQVFAKTNTICCIIGLIIGFLSGQILYLKNVYYPIYLSLILFIISALFFFSFPKEKIDKLPLEKGKRKEKNKKYSVRQNIGLILVFIGYSFTDVLNSAPGNQWSKAFESLEAYGYIWVGFNIASLLGNFVISRVKMQEFTKVKSDLLYAVETSLLIAVYIFNKKSMISALILFLLYVFCYQIHITLYSANLHTKVITDDKTRNMHISLFNMTNSLVFPICLLHQSLRL